MDTNKLIYRDDLSVRQNMETLFNHLRFCVEQFDHGRTSYEKMTSTEKSVSKLEADSAYLSMMSGIDIPGGDTNE